MLGQRIRDERIYNNLPSPKVPLKISCQIKKSDIGNFLLRKETLGGLEKSFLRNKTFDVKSLFAETLLTWLESANRGLEKRIRCVNPSLIVAEGLLTGYVCLPIAKRLNTPIIVDNHSWMSWEISEKQRLTGNLLRPLFQWIEAHVFSESDYLSVASYGMKRNFERTYNLAPSKIVVASNGGDIVNMSARYKTPAKVVYAGALSKQEGIVYYPLLVEKLRIQIDTGRLDFFLIGDGYERNKILASVYQEKLKMKYLGWLTHDATLRELAEMNIGTVFAYGSDAFPIKTFDYMSVGLPIVAFEVGSLGRIIREENVGFAVKPGDMNSYAESILSLTERRIWEEKSENAKRALEEKYNWGKTLQPLIEICSRIADAR